MRIPYRSVLLLTVCALLATLAVGDALPVFAAEESAEGPSETEDASSDEAASTQTDAEESETEEAPLDDVQKKWRQELLRLQKWDLTLENLGYACGSFVLLWIGV
ncbi:MAG: hypothetical protein U9Q79_09745, partial [Candidatus Hydrogenedentes bacterium]|nr:hypothetical protein [Candidatus Hydrogenedentota bacterium]